MLKFVPVFTSYSTMGGIAIYVRKRKYKRFDYYERELPDAYYIRYDDRELFITKPGCRDYEYQTFLKDYDYAINLDMFGAFYDTEEIMVTFVKKAFSIKERLYDKHSGAITIYGDSGGYQLITGTLNFVDPVDVAIYYNRCVNLGMPLDIPPIFEVDNSTLERSAKIQKLNTIKMLQVLDEDVKLYNIIHGFNRIQREIYFDVVKDVLPNDMIAIGGLYKGTPFDCVLNIFNTIEITKSKKFHIFGMSGAYLIPMFALIGMNYDLTTDSSEHIQYGIRMGFLTFYKGRMTSFGVGNAYTGKSSEDSTIHSNSSFQSLSCSCDICNAIGTNKIYYRSKFSTISHAIISFHNLFLLKKYVEVWNDIVNSESIPYIFKMLEKTYPRKIKDTYLKCARFILDTFDSSLSKTYKKYRSFFSDFAIKGFRPNPMLFSRGDSEEEKNIAFYNTILERYEKYHEGLNIKQICLNEKGTKSFKPSQLNKKSYKSDLFSVKNRKSRKRKRKE